jgi:hypothetical protein
VAGNGLTPTPTVATVVIIGREETIGHKGFPLSLLHSEGVKLSVLIPLPFSELLFIVALYSVHLFLLSQFSC